MFVEEDSQQPLFSHSWPPPTHPKWRALKLSSKKKNLSQMLSALSVVSIYRLAVACSQQAGRHPATKNALGLSLLLDSSTNMWMLEVEALAGGFGAKVWALWALRAVRPCDPRTVSVTLFFSRNQFFLL